MNLDEAAERARILKALGHPARMRIVDELSRGERCGCEFVPMLALDQSVVSRHLASLRNCGIVSERREGVRVVYRLAAPCILRALDCTIEVLRQDAARRAGALRGADPER